MLNEVLHVAVPTAFYKDESLNTEGTIGHIKDLYAKGIRSVLVCGSTGEQHSLSLAEKGELLEALMTEEDLLDQMEVIFGVSAIRQAQAEELAKRIRPTKIAGILLSFPPYLLLSQKEALIYAEKVIKSAEKPVIIYNNTRRTGFDLAIESLAQLSQSKWVIGLKEAREQERISLLKESITKEDFYFYAAGELGLEEKIHAGYSRLSSVSGNVYLYETQTVLQKLLDHQSLTPEEKKQWETIVKNVYSDTPLPDMKKRLNEEGAQLGICRSPLGNL